MKVISEHAVDVLYREILTSVIFDGKKSSPRGLSCRELIPVLLELKDPRCNIVSNTARAINPGFLYGEFFWIMAGREDLASIKLFNSKMAEFSDDGLILHGAYGRRLRNWDGQVDQFKHVLEILEYDKFSRQAVMLIYDPKFDHNSKDIPCNNQLVFNIRDERLNLDVFIRSQDVILGFPYDIFHWTTLQQIFAKILNVKLGIYRQYVCNLHFYESNYLWADRILKFYDLEPELIKTDVGNIESKEDFFYDLNLTNQIYNEFIIHKSKELTASLKGLRSTWFWEKINSLEGYLQKKHIQMDEDFFKLYRSFKGKD